MSALPLTQFDAESNAAKWQELSRLAESVTFNSPPELRFNIVIDTLSQLAGGEFRYWLSGTIRSRLTLEPGTTGSLLAEPTENMQHAVNNNQLLFFGGNEKDDELPVMLTIPLVNQQVILGAVELSRSQPPGFDAGEVSLIQDLCFECLLILKQQYWATVGPGTRDQASYHNIAQISATLHSILDLESLLNSTLTLLHQYFNFSPVGLFIKQNSVSSMLSGAVISGSGYAARNLVIDENSDHPIVLTAITRKELLITGARGDSRLIKGIGNSDTQAEWLFPLLDNGQLVGVLDFCSNSPIEYTEDVLNSLRLLAENITIAIRNARLFGLLSQQHLVNRRIMALIVSFPTDAILEDLLQELLIEFEKFIPCTSACFWLQVEGDPVQEVPGKNSTLKLGALYITEDNSSNDPRAEKINLIEIKDKLIEVTMEPDGLLHRYLWLNEVTNAAQPAVRRASDLEPMGQILDYAGDYSALAAPIFFKQKFMGIVVMVHSLRDQYDSDTIRLITSCLEPVSIALENYQLTQAIKDRNWSRNLELELLETIQESSTLDELITEVTRLMPLVVNGNACQYYDWDPASGIFLPHLHAESTTDPDRTQPGIFVSPDEVAPFQHLLELEEVVVFDYGEYSSFLPEGENLEPGRKSTPVMLFPVSLDGNLIGAMLFYIKDELIDLESEQTMWEEKYALIPGLLSQVALRIEAIERISTQEEEAYISVALLQVAQAIVSLNEFDDILGAIIRIMPILVGVKRSIIFLWDDNRQIFQLSQYYGFSKSEPLLMHKELRKDEFEFLEAVLGQNQVVYHRLTEDISPSQWNEITLQDILTLQADKSQVEGSDNSLLRSIGFDQYPMLIGFPLAVQDTVYGVLVVEEEISASRSYSSHIRDKRIEIIRGIAQQTALVLKNELLLQETHNSERMERELQLAREIQAAFLPDRVPSHPAWEFEVFWEPARIVGGDFYDFIPLDENRLGIVIADVADKGMPAALYMTLIRTLIRSAAQRSSSVVEILCEVNRLFMLDAKNSMFVTVFYAEADLLTGSTRYCNSGHNPPITYFPVLNEMDEFYPTGPAIGIFDDFSIMEGYFQLQPGSYLILYTDGITEAFSSQDEQYGTERLKEVLRKQSYSSSNNLINEIDHSVREFTGGADLSDDMTLVVIQRKRLS